MHASAHLAGRARPPLDADAGVAVGSAVHAEVAVRPAGIARARPRFLAVEPHEFRPAAALVHRLLVPIAGPTVGARAAVARVDVSFAGGLAHQLPVPADHKLRGLVKRQRGRRHLGPGWQSPDRVEASITSDFTGRSGRQQRCFAFG